MDATNLILAILGIGLLVAFHELGHHLMALWCGMRVRRYSVGFGKPLVRWTHNGVDYTVGAIPLGGFVDIVGMNPLEEGAQDDPRSYQRRPMWARALVVAAGPAFNYALAWLVFVGIFAFGEWKTEQEFLITEVVAGSGAEAAGIQTGDVIVQVAGQPIGRDDSLPDSVNASGGKPMTLGIRRGKDLLVVQAVPHEMGGAFRLGVGIRSHAVGAEASYTVSQAVVRASQTTVMATVGMLSNVGDLLRRVFVPGESALDQLRGPPEMVKQLKDAAGRSLMDYLQLFGLLSLMLGLFNLFPIPPLDGSKLVFLGAESLVRRAIPARAQIYIHGVGMMFMLTLMVVVSVKDFLRKDPDEPAPPAATKKADPPPPAEAPAPAQP